MGADARLKMLFSTEAAAQLAGYDARRDLEESLPAQFDRWDGFSQAQYLETDCSAAGLHPVVPGRPHGDGARRRRPVSVPGSPRRGVRRVASAAAEDEGAEREILS